MTRTEIGGEGAGDVLLPAFAGSPRVGLVALARFGGAATLLGAAAAVAFAVAAAARVPALRFDSAPGVGSLLLDAIGSGAASS